jgi:hypothetical protein
VAPERTRVELCTALLTQTHTYTRSLKSRDVGEKKKGGGVKLERAVSSAAAQSCTITAVVKEEPIHESTSTSCEYTGREEESNTIRTRTRMSKGS